MISGWDHSDARRKSEKGQLLLWHTFLILRESTARLFLLWASFWFWMGLDNVICETQRGESLSYCWTNTPLETSVRWFLNQSKERPDTPSHNDGKARMCKVCQKDAHGTCYIANKNTKGKVISKCSKFQIMYMENIDILYAEFSKKWNNDLVIANQWYDFLFRWYERPREVHCCRVIMILCHFFKKFLLVNFLKNHPIWIGFALFTFYDVRTVSFC